MTRFRCEFYPERIKKTHYMKGGKKVKYVRPRYVRVGYFCISIIKEAEDIVSAIEECLEFAKIMKWEFRSIYQLRDYNLVRIHDRERDI